MDLKNSRKRLGYSLKLFFSTQFLFLNSLTRALKILVRFEIKFFNMYPFKTKDFSTGFRI
jgi:hypothetical protein